MNFIKKVGKGSTVLYFKNRRAAVAAVRYVQSIEEESDLVKLTEKIFAAVKLEVYDYQTPKIARRQDRDYANQAGGGPEDLVDRYTERYISN